MTTHFTSFDYFLLQEFGFVVPAHHQLNLNEGQCRYPGCSVSYAHKTSRQQHERISHGFQFRRGITYSSTNLQISFRQSSPVTPSLSRGIRRFGSVSPIRQLSVSPVARSISTDAMVTSLQNSTDPPMVTSLPSSSDSDLTDSDTHTCPCCLDRIQTSRPHNCSLQCNDDLLLQNNIQPVLLVPPNDREETAVILGNLSLVDRLNLCISQKWCLKDLFPLVFMGQQRAGIHGAFPVLTLNASSRFRQNEEIIRRYLETESQLSLPKHIIIQDNLNNVRAYLGPRYLKPPNSINFQETDSTYIITRRSNVHLSTVNDVSEQNLTSNNDVDRDDAAGDDDELNDMNDNDDDDDDDDDMNDLIPPLTILADNHNDNFTGDVNTQASQSDLQLASALLDSTQDNAATQLTSNVTNVPIAAQNLGNTQSATSNLPHSSAGTQANAGSQAQIGTGDVTSNVTIMPVVYASAGTPANAGSQAGTHTQTAAQQTTNSGSAALAGIRQLFPQLSGGADGLGK